jgi:hypothetical protein
MCPTIDSQRAAQHEHEAEVVKRQRQAEAEVLERQRRAEAEVVERQAEAEEAARIRESGDG